MASADERVAPVLRGMGFAGWIHRGRLAVQEGLHQPWE